MKCCMNSLYIFNPENDLALAAGTPYFTPPAAALRLASAAAVLPVWYAGDDDFVLASAEDAAWIDSIRGRVGIGPEVVTDISPSVNAVIPWGWSGYLKHRLVLSGIPERCLPSDAALDDIRDCSHRFTSVLMHRAIAARALPYPLPAEPLLVEDVNVIATLIGQGEELFIKSPLSGSGRGIIDTCSAPARQVLRLAAGVIRRQGAVLVEKSLRKIADFAMLFDYFDGKACFVGYSLFFNSGYSTYSGNVLMDDDGLRLSVASYGIPVGWIDATRDAVIGALQDVLGNRYNGPLGVDMMVYDRDGMPCIAPCVEVNVRMTMGRVAHSLASRYLAPGSHGVMRIVRNSEQLSIGMCDMVDGRLSHGSMSLTPPAHRDFAIVMEIDE